MKITSLDQAEKTTMSMDGAPLFSFRVFTVGPGGHTPFHAHPFEHVNYIIEGKGV